MPDDPKETKDSTVDPDDPKETKDPADDLEEITVPDGADDEMKALIKKRNSELRSLRERLKAAEPLAAKAKELEDASKSELQKAQEATTNAQKDAQEARTELLRLQVASDKGLKPALAKRLSGTTREELEADADELLEAFPDSGDGDGTKPPSTKPKERLKGGGDPTEEPEETDPRKLAEAVPRT